MANPPDHPSTRAEADAWMEILQRFRLIHAAVQDPCGQWLVQLSPQAPVHLLRGPQEVLRLARDVQRILAELEAETR
ncbi:hypothetical protein [Streptomyces decoyicus]|uniref:hypothetical protein n=1 Tax=Streptomyces decoyicus TaxID=249567 RepID=UPI003868FA29